MILFASDGLYIGAQGRAKAPEPRNNEVVMARSPNRIQSAPMRRRPTSPIVPLIIILALIVGGLVFLSRHASMQPTQTIEVDVAHDAAAH